MLEVDSWGSYTSSHQNTVRFKWKKFNQASINVFMQNSSDFKKNFIIKAQSERILSGSPGFITVPTKKPPNNLRYSRPDGSSG